MPHHDDSSSPFPEIDSNHGGPPRDVIAVYLRQLRDDSREVKNDLKEHRENTSKALEEIRIQIARMPSGGCPQADRCAEMRETVEQMKIDNAKQAGAKTVLVMVGSVLGSLITMVVPYLFTKGK